jgi:glycine dehydrogenase
MAGFYAVFHGPDGLKAIAQRIHRKTVRLAEGLKRGGFVVEPRTYFDTITVDVGPLQQAVMKSAVDEGINLRRVGTTRIGITLDERTRPATVEAVWRAFGIEQKDDDYTPRYNLPDELIRTSQYLTHPIFHMNRAETEMMRYMRRLADRDLALDRAMIPLGSCTMKLNSAAEMMPVSWDEFALLHPYAPKDQAEGYAEIIEDLSAKLCDVTGYDAISMQPNSGAQGEYAGLLSIAGFHRANGQEHRKICLIPMSAHGTNPASAQMVGWTVVPVQSDDAGNIDLDDFRAKAELHSRRPCRLHDYLSIHARRV